MGDNPDIQWALDILTPEPDYKPSFLTEYGLVIGAPITFFLSVCFRNKHLARPTFSGFHKHILMSLVGFGGAYKIKEIYDNYYARKDQMLRHYVMLHPEDFPQPERKKWSEVFDPWVPIR